MALKIIAFNPTKCTKSFEEKSKKSETEKVDTLEASYHGCKPTSIEQYLAVKSASVS